MKSSIIIALLAVTSAEIITIDTDDFQAATPEEAMFFNEELDLEEMGAEPTTPCCHSCVEPLEKYHSVDHVFNNCGEACMAPSKFWIYKLFEPGLEKSTTNTPCADREFTEYENTPTHGFGPIKMTLDLYAKKKDLEVGEEEFGKMM